MQQLRVAGAEFAEPIEHFFRLGDLEARAQCAAGIHQGHEILRVLLDRLFKQLHRFLEPVGQPQRARPLQLGHIHAQSGNDAGGPGGGGQLTWRTGGLFSAPDHDGYF